MTRLVEVVLCRMLGRRCTVRRPASRDLIKDLRDHARREEARTVAARRRREDIAATIRGGGRV